MRVFFQVTCVLTIMKDILLWAPCICALFAISDDKFCDIKCLCERFYEVQGLKYRSMWSAIDLNVENVV